jgi:Holliday junction DNA helicase RuvB
LEFYKPADLAKILKVNAEKLHLGTTEEALILLATRSRGTPRIANHLLRFARDYATVQAIDAVRQNGYTAYLTVPVVEQALQLQGIDELGLNAQDRQYLRILVSKARPIGADALAATLGVKVDTLQGVIEPYLLQTELMERGPRGRVCTDKAVAHLAAAA